MFKRIASALASAGMIASTVALAAAANFPAPFVQNGAADVAVVYGTNAAATDLVAVTDITASLSNTLASQTATTTTGPRSGEDFVRLDKSTDKLNLNDRFNVVKSTLNDDDMPGLLVDGTYTAGDNDEFDFEQKITLGSEQITHFRDSDYEDLMGLDTRTPVIGIKFSSGKSVMNYTLDFLDDAETDYVSTSSSDLEDFEGSDLPLFDKTYYVSDAKNGTSATYMGVWTLLDSANTAIVNEGETVTVTVGDTNYDVSVDYIDADSTALMVNGKSTKDNAEGVSEKLADGSYIGIRDIRKLAVAGEIGSVEFSIGTGKLEITSGSDIKLNDNAITGVKGYIYRGSPSSGTTQKIDKIVIEWKTDDEEFLTADSDLVMPGFGGLKLSMDAFVRPTEEKITIEKDDDTSLEITVPIKDGDASFNILYGNATDFQGIGKSATERLATNSSGSIQFFNKKSGDDYDKWVVVSYNTTKDAESYLLSFDVTEDTTSARNETTIKNIVTGDTWSDKKAGDVFDLGDVSLTISAVNKNSSDEWVDLAAGTNVNFNTIYTPGGMRIYLPYLAANATTTSGAINLTQSIASPGYNKHSWYLIMDGEDKDDTLAAGTALSLTLDQTSGGKYEVKEVNATGGGVGKSNGGENAQEVGSNSQTYEVYVKDDVAPRLLHYTKPDEDWAEVYYPSGDSESYAAIYVSAEATTISSGGGTSLGSVSVKDTEAASVSSKNLIVVGGSCVNTVAAELLGSSAPMCGDAWEAKTGVGAGEFLIQSFSRNSKVATLVAGYNAGDTTNAAKYATTETVDTTVGKKYVGTTATSAELVTA